MEMYDVYISYTRADQRLYEALRDALRGRAVSVWDDGDIKMEELIRISDRITEAVSACCPKSR